MDQKTLPEALALLLATSRALYELLHSFHWQTSGPSFYADHLLFERLYGVAYQDIDAIAEKLIGVTGRTDLVGPQLQSQLTSKVLDGFEISDEPSGFAASALLAEHGLLALLADLLQTPDLSQGLQNFLQGIADTHETSVYLLGQRTKG
jgi:hypothetical protein